MYVWVCWIGGAEYVTSSHESFSRVGKARDMIGGMTFGNVVFRCI